MVYVCREADSMPPGISLWDGRVAVCLHSGHPIARRRLYSSEGTA